MFKLSASVAFLAALVPLLWAELSAAQVQLSTQGGVNQAAPQPGFGQPSFGQPAFPPAYVSPSEQPRTQLELGVLYGTSVAYGAGMGIWFSTELGFDDPATFLIAPAILGVAAPVGVYFLDRPKLKRGVPAAMATGVLIGAGEGLGVWSYQFVTATKADAWGFRGLARAEAIGATLGAAGGLALGYLQAPSPKSSLLMSSSVLWGTAIGSMFGYGATSANRGFGLSNDGAALGGLIGFNVGLAASAGLSTVYIPSYKSLGAMWLGAGIGFAASLPVYLFYVSDDAPPAKRGLIFSATTTTLGIGAGALFTSGSKDSADADTAPRFARVYGFAPFWFEKGAGLMVTGELQ